MMQRIRRKTTKAATSDCVDKCSGEYTLIQVTTEIIVMAIYKKTEKYKQRYSINVPVYIFKVLIKVL